MDSHSPPPPPPARLVPYINEWTLRSIAMKALMMRNEDDTAKAALNRTNEDDEAENEARCIRKARNDFLGLLPPRVARLLHQHFPDVGMDLDVYFSKRLATTLSELHLQAVDENRPLFAIIEDGKYFEKLLNASTPLGQAAPNETLHSHRYRDMHTCPIDHRLLPLLKRELISSPAPLHLLVDENMGQKQLNYIRQQLQDAVAQVKMETGRAVHASVVLHACNGAHPVALSPFWTVGVVHPCLDEGSEAAVAAMRWVYGGNENVAREKLIDEVCRGVVDPTLALHVSPSEAPISAACYGPHADDAQLAKLVQLMDASDKLTLNLPSREKVRECWERHCANPTSVVLLGDESLNGFVRELSQMYLIPCRKRIQRLWWMGGIVSFERANIAERPLVLMLFNSMNDHYEEVPLLSGHRSNLNPWLLEYLYHHATTNNNLGRKSMRSLWTALETIVPRLTEMSMESLSLLLLDVQADSRTAEWPKALPNLRDVLLDTLSSVYVERDSLTQRRALESMFSNNLRVAVACVCGTLEEPIAPLLSKAMQEQQLDSTRGPHELHLGQACASCGLRAVNEGFCEVCGREEDCFFGLFDD